MRIRWHDNYKFIDYGRRVDVIYDSVVHEMTLFQITHKYQMKYNTVRSIVNSFKGGSRVNVKRKIQGYSRKKKAIVVDKFMI